jgi:hypothetical protein
MWMTQGNGSISNYNAKRRATSLQRQHDICEFPSNRAQPSSLPYMKKMNASQQRQLASQEFMGDQYRQFVT